MALRGLLLICVGWAASTSALPWPLPAKFANGSSTLVLHPRFRILDVSTIATDTVAEAIVRYQTLIFPHGEPSALSKAHSADFAVLRVLGRSAGGRWLLKGSRGKRRVDGGPNGGGGGGGGAEDGEKGVLTSVHINVTDYTTLLEAHPQLDTDESYQLVIPQRGPDAWLTSKTVYGALRGLETFSQLVEMDFQEGEYVVRGSPWSIEDRPRFPHRGLLLDTARHFQPIAHVKAVLDSMAYAKLNVLHWHMVDTEAFPLQSLVYPKLWDGAYSEQERYLQTDVKEIVEYARLRGIRVMPEFDMPGHAASWCVGYPAICPSTTCPQPLNPASNDTFELIQGLLSEVTGNGAAAHGLFPDAMLHLGGDEVDTSCWTTTAAVKQWLEARTMTTGDGYKYFLDRAAQVAMSFHRTPVQWVEVFENFGSKLHNETIVHIWKEKSTLQKVVGAGYRALVSNSDVWYLDHLDVTWDKMYDNDPLDGIAHDQQHLILGGEACMWGETVDPSDLQSTVWPRAAAVAERLWSPLTESSINSSDPTVLQRLHDFRCLLTRRGIAAAPVLNPWARAPPPHQDSCYAQ